jgi:hypothetical protein
VGQYIYLTLEPTYAIQDHAIPPWLLYWGQEIQNPPTITPSSSCPIPSITSVTPSTWIAGGTYPIKVLGSGFVTSGAATENCPETQLAITADQTGTVPTWPDPRFPHYATGQEGIVEIESDWTANKRERTAGRLCPFIYDPTQAKDA